MTLIKQKETEQAKKQIQNKKTRLEVVKQPLKNIWIWFYMDRLKIQ